MSTKKITPENPPGDGTQVAPPGPMNASEAVYGLLGWLTTRWRVTTLSARHGSAEAARLADKFCELNELPPVREGRWADNLTHPPEGMSDLTVLPDGSAFFTSSWPLPKDHWLYAPDTDENQDAPCPYRVGQGSRVGFTRSREQMVSEIREAAQWAVRGATDNGSIVDFDPDALVQNMVLGLVGYFTPDGKR